VIARERSTAPMPCGDDGEEADGEQAAAPAPLSPEGWVAVLRVDHELAAQLPAETVDAAAPLAIAPRAWLDPGPWDPVAPPAEAGAGHLGYLVVEGFLARQVKVLQRPATELLGPGDLLVPWEPDRTEPFTSAARWEVLEPACVAVLDRRFTAVLSRWPDITAAIASRAVSRSRALALALAIGQLVGIELRLLVLLWHIAERWGTREGEDTVLPVHLTHHLLASLISAQRPTVTRAITRLAEQGLASRRDDGLVVLHGDPPARFRRSAAAG
jgi:CRP/FNR family cyclic AMP-dependent transcriptional regulator